MNFSVTGEYSPRSAIDTSRPSKFEHSLLSWIHSAILLNWIAYRTGDFLLQRVKYFHLNGKLKSGIATSRRRQFHQSRFWTRENEYSGWSSGTAARLSVYLSDCVDSACVEEHAVVLRNTFTVHLRDISGKIRELAVAARNGRITIERTILKPWPPGNRSLFVWPCRVSTPLDKDIIDSAFRGLSFPVARVASSSTLRPG